MQIREMHVCRFRKWGEGTSSGITLVHDNRLHDSRVV